TLVKVGPEPGSKRTLATLLRQAGVERHHVCGELSWGEVPDRSEYYFFLSASCAASVMRSATFCGSCNMATWQVGRSTAFPRAFSAPACCIAGIKVRSFVAITCHEGFDFQAACVSFSSNIGP